MLPSRREFARFLVPWRQTKTHGQYFIGNLELKNHPNPHNLKWKTVSQFLIGKVERKGLLQQQRQRRFLSNEVSIPYR